MILANADGGLSTMTTAPFDSTAGSPDAPIIDEHALFAGFGRSHHLIGFELVFAGSAEPSQAAGPDRFAITQAEKRTRKSVTEPVAVIARYQAATDSVDLLVLGNPAFKLGGQILVDASATEGIVNISGDGLPGGTVSDAPGVIAG